MIGRARHLGDDRLHECCFAERCGDAIDPRAAEHLADCAECAARYREVAGFLEAVSREGTADADEVFTADRLQQQHDAILRRLELAGRPARVISFPVHPTASTSQTKHIAPRWFAVAAAAAVAGLIVGVGVGGTFLPSRSSQNASTSRLAAQAAAARVTPVPVRVNTPVAGTEATDDDRFLLELELALQRPHTRELLSFDNLTPHVREIGNRVR